MIKILLGAVLIGCFSGLYVLSSSLYEKVFHKKARYGCSGGCSGCSERDSCDEVGKGGH